MTILSETYKGIYEENFEVAKKAQGVLARLKSPLAENIAKVLNAIERGAKLAESYEGDDMWLENRWNFLMCLSNDVVNTLMGELFRLDKLAENESLLKEYRALKPKEDVIALRDEFKKREEEAKNAVENPLKEMNDNYRNLDTFISVARGFAESVEEAEQKIDEYEKRQTGVMPKA